MSKMNRTPTAFEKLPEEIVLSILDYHFDLERVPLSVATEWSCRLPQLQLQHKLQMSLCRVSKRFQHSVSRLFLQNGLLRVTCWVDPHIDFYYLSPTICLSDRTDMFQVSCPEVVIDLAHGLPEAVSVRSIVSVQMLPRVLELAKLHHDAALRVLPELSDDLALCGKMTIDISCESLSQFPYLRKAEAIISAKLPCSERIDAGRSLLKSAAASTVIDSSHTTLRYGLDTWKPCTDLPRPAWDLAFEAGRAHCLSTDSNHRRLGLQILRYLLATMLVAIEPWNTDQKAYAGLDADVQMMTLISAVLIDALVVEPNLLSVFYGEASSDAVRNLHHEICPCKYLPYGICAGTRYGFAKDDETWTFIQTATNFLHSMLVIDKSRRMIRLNNLRKKRERMSQGMTNVEQRCAIYIKSLEHYYKNARGCCYVPVSAPEKVYIPA